MACAHGSRTLQAIERRPTPPDARSVDRRLLRGSRRSYCMSDPFEGGHDANRAWPQPVESGPASRATVTYTESGETVVDMGRDAGRGTRMEIHVAPAVPSSLVPPVPHPSSLVPLVPHPASRVPRPDPGRPLPSGGLRTRPFHQRRNSASACDTISSMMAAAGCVSRTPFTDSPAQCGMASMAPVA